MARIGRFLFITIVVGMAGWSSLSLWYSLPAAETLRAVLSIGTVLLTLGGLIHVLLKGRIVLSLAPAILAIAATIFWWLTLQPSNDRDWLDDVAHP